MRTLPVVVVVLCGFAGSATAQERERFAERTPAPRVAQVHTMERAGNPLGLNRVAVLTPGSHDAGGYIGGGRLLHNNATVKGIGVVTGPTTQGTYGTDFVGFKNRVGRVFLGASYDPSRGPTIAHAYRTQDPIHVPDVGTFRPVRESVIEKRDDAEERKGGGH